MLFHPKLSNIESSIIFKIKKLSNSEFSETRLIRGHGKVKGIDCSDSFIKFNDAYIFFLNDDHVYTEDGTKYLTLDLISKEIKELNGFLETFIFSD